jgi:NAD(P)-dependent dehydrogenase (short-subunit alcohol dehydrogenase family)
MNSFLNLKNKTILVTGASSGIGREVAIQLDKHDANTIITARNKQRLNETRDELSYYFGIPSETYLCDLSEEEQIIELVDKLPKLDGVVFCAGVIEYTPVKFINSSKVRNTLSINFTSQVLLTQQLLKKKKLKLNSSLIYISSIASKIGVPGTALYSASKAALNSFVKVTAAELAPHGIRANTVCPGVVNTPMGEKALEVNNDITKHYPLGLGTPLDVANACLYLLSDVSKWQTGTEFILDGGLTLN